MNRVQVIKGYTPSCHDAIRDKPFKGYKTGERLVLEKDYGYLVALVIGAAFCIEDTDYTVFRGRSEAIAAAHEANLRVGIYDV